MGNRGGGGAGLGVLWWMRWRGAARAQRRPAASRPGGRSTRHRRMSPAAAAAPFNMRPSCRAERGRSCSHLQLFVHNVHACTLQGSFKKIVCCLLNHAHMWLGHGDCCSPQGRTSAAHACTYSHHCTHAASGGTQTQQAQQGSCLGRSRTAMAITRVAAQPACSTHAWGSAPGPTTTIRPAQQQQQQLE